MGFETIPSFTGLLSFLVLFIDFYRVLLRFTRCLGSLSSFIGSYVCAFTQLVPSFHSFFHVEMGFTECCWVLLGYIRFYWA